MSDRTLSPNGPTPDVLRALYESRDWPALVRSVAEIGEDRVLEDAQAGFYFADARRRLGDREAALRVLARVEPEAKRRGERHLQLDISNLVGICLFELGRNVEAEERFGALLELSTELGDEGFAARASNNLGMLANIRGRRDLALTYYERALAAYQRRGYHRGLAQTHHNLGISYRDLGLVHDADAHYQKAIRFASIDPSEDVIALAESERAYLRARSGDGVLAEALAARALERFDRIGDPLGRAEATRVLAAAARTRGEEELAAERLEEALAVARAHADPLLRAEIQRDRGLLLRDRGDPAAAREALADAADHFAIVGAAAESEAMRAIAEALAG